jgi:restriction system protein
MQPKWNDYAEPILRYLAESGEPVRISTIQETGADLLKLTSEQRAVTLKSGRAIYRDRAAWALTYMKYCSWVHTPRRAHWQITAEGRARLTTGVPISESEMRRTKDALYPRTPRVRKEAAEVAPHEETSLTPRDRIDGAVNELRETVSAELLEQLRSSNPTFFEVAVLDVLKAMGYAGDLGRAEHAGKTGDGGIDGVLYLDRLGLERVHVQAKRWQNSVGEGVVRDFAGAMDVRGATKGVIVTTGDFTKSAKRYVEMSPKVIKLLDGEHLAELMVEFAVGVTHERTVVIPKLDLDYFES